jgi:hypothetical protein
MKRFYTLACWDLGWVLKDNILYSDVGVIIDKLTEDGFEFDSEDEYGFDFTRGEGGYGDLMRIMKLTYVEATECN